jgi:hypothetical protein
VEVDDFFVDEAFIEGPPPRAKTPTLEKGFEEAEWGIWVPSMRSWRIAGIYGSWEK